MKKTGMLIVIILLGVLCFNLAGFVSALDIPQYKDKYVNDFANVLNPSNSAMLKGLFYEVDTNTTAEAVFVSFDTIETEAISDYAVRILQTWGVGKSDKDNGIVILYVKDINKIFAATGYGVEGILPDSKIGRLFDENYVLRRDAGDVQQGIIDFSVALSDVLFENREEILSEKASPKDVSQIDITSIIFIIVIVIFIMKIIARAAYSKKPRSSWPWFIPLFLPSGRSSGGFGGGGFGGGAGGGGGAGR
ncbi:TPM domain-containing protein [Candidatus Pacearchaeota archaeon]|nr:TPM domain-containing protein [Candidatus Pacearchaeota archaeon]